jgi:hypothetical protein
MSMGSSGVSSVKQGVLRMVRSILTLLTITSQERKEIGGITGNKVDQVGRTRVHLRKEPTKNNQEKNVRWAKDYEL